MTDALTELDVLHAVRVRGVLPLETLTAVLGAEAATVAERLTALEGDDWVFLRQGRRVSGYALTEAGRQHHAELLGAWRATQPLDELERVYDSFLALNGRFKSLCAQWQHLPPDDEAARWDAVGRLSAFHEEAAAVFERAGGLVPRMARYVPRLADAERLLADGDERFFTGATVESYHTIWFEAHEDLLLSLGRDRATEGSF